MCDSEPGRRHAAWPYCRRPSALTTIIAADPVSALCCLGQQSQISHRFVTFPSSVPSRPQIDRAPIRGCFHSFTFLRHYRHWQSRKYSIAASPGYLLCIAPLDLDIRPDLVASKAGSEQGLLWSFHLRIDVVFLTLYATCCICRVYSVVC